jgi:hypothetical protein
VLQPGSYLAGTRIEILPVLVAAFAAFFFLAYSFWSVLPITSSKGCVHSCCYLPRTQRCTSCSGNRRWQWASAAGISVFGLMLQGKAAGHLRLLHYVHLPRHRRHRDGHVRGGAILRVCIACRIAQSVAAFDA